MAMSTTAGISMNEMYTIEELSNEPGTASGATCHETAIASATVGATSNQSATAGTTNNPVTTD